MLVLISAAITQNPAIHDHVKTGQWNRALNKLFSVLSILLASLSGLDSWPNSKIGQPDPIRWQLWDRWAESSGALFFFHSQFLSPKSGDFLNPNHFSAWFLAGRAARPTAFGSWGYNAQRCVRPARGHQRPACRPSKWKTSEARSIHGLRDRPGAPTEIGGRSVRCSNGICSCR